VSNRSDHNKTFPEPDPVAKPGGGRVDAAQAALVGASPEEVYTCWSEIGVYGKGTCGELSKFVHCRNCPVYSSAGVRLLDRVLPPDYRRESTEHFAQEKSYSTPAKLSAVVFRISSEWLALPTQAFQEVAERRLIHSLPHRRQGLVLGLVNIRGELLICVSLGRILGLENLPSREALKASHHRLLVVSWDGNRFAFPVNEVHGTHRFQPHELKPPPATLAKSSATYTQGIFLWRNRLIGFLEADSLFATLNRSLT
jgi:chemotaxis-related protein WspD